MWKGWFEEKKLVLRKRRREEASRGREEGDEARLEDKRKGKKCAFKEEAGAEACLEDSRPEAVDRPERVATAATKCLPTRLSLL